MRPRDVDRAGARRAPTLRHAPLRIRAGGRRRLPARHGDLPPALLQPAGRRRRASRGRRRPLRPARHRPRQAARPSRLPSRARTAGAREPVPAGGLPDRAPAVRPRRRRARERARVDVRGRGARLPLHHHAAAPARGAAHAGHRPVVRGWALHRGGARRGRFHRTSRRGVRRGARVQDPREGRRGHASVRPARDRLHRKRQQAEPRVGARLALPHPAHDGRAGRRAFALRLLPLPPLLHRERAAGGEGGALHAQQLQPHAERREPHLPPAVQGTRAGAARTAGPHARSPRGARDQ